jgi:uncharacterized membrane protein
LKRQHRAGADAAAEEVSELRKQLQSALVAEDKRHDAEYAALTELCEVRKELLLRQEELSVALSRNLQLLRENDRLTLVIEVYQNEAQ